MPKLKNAQSEFDVVREINLALSDNHGETDKAGRTQIQLLAKEFSSLEIDEQKKSYFYNSVKALANGIDKNDMTFLSNYLDLLEHSSYDIRSIHTELTNALLRLSKSQEDLEKKGLIARTLVNSGCRNTIFIRELSSLKSTNYWLWFDSVSVINWAEVSKFTSKHLKSTDDYKALIVRLPNLLNKIDYSLLSESIDSWLKVLSPESCELLQNYWSKMTQTRKSLLPKETEISHELHQFIWGTQWSTTPFDHAVGL